MDLPVGISTLQHTDRWIGAPLCAILTFFRRIFEAAGPPGPRQFDGFSSSSSRSKDQPSSLILQFFVRPKWLDVKTFTSSYSRIIASFST